MRLQYVLVWASAHRDAMIFIVGLTMWISAYYWFFKHNIMKEMRHRRPHKWSVDMATKVTKGGRRDV